MGDDEPQVGYRREWVPPVKDVHLKNSQYSFEKAKNGYLINKAR